VGVSGSSGHSLADWLCIQWQEARYAAIRVAAAVEFTRTGSVQYSHQSGPNANVTGSQPIGIPTGHFPDHTRRSDRATRIPAAITDE
jgi:hypothetical protein